MNNYTVVGQSGTNYAQLACTHPLVIYKTANDGKRHLCLNEGVTFIKGQSGIEYPVCSKCGKILEPMR